LCLLDELRAHDIPQGREATDELTELMKKIIQKTSNKNFDLNSVENPKLQFKYRQIENIALQGVGPGLEDEEFMDTTGTEWKSTILMPQD